MKFGVIGLGGMGRHHARVYAELGLLGAVYDIDPSRTEQYSELYNVWGASSLNDFFTCNLSGVSVVTPTPVHPETVSQCLKAGLNVLCEKPMAPTLEEAGRMVEEADSFGATLAVGYIEKYNPAFEAVKYLHGQGAFGDLTSVNIKRVGGVPRSADNVILDLMTHDFNLLINLLGKPPERVCTSAQRRDSILDSAQVLLDFGSASATCEANWLTPVKIRSMQVTGTGGYCEVDLISQKLTRFLSVDPVNFRRKTSSACTLEILSFKEEPLKRELQAFIDDDREELVLAQEGYNTLDLTLRAMEEVSR